MFYFVQGIMEFKNNLFAVILSQGIGYKIFSSAINLSKIQLKEDVRLYTKLVIKEDSQTLYGFLDLKELELFETLISVSGIGPKMALLILSNFEADEFARIVAGSDLLKLSKVPGIGKKTSERIVFELKDKIKKEMSQDTERGHVEDHKEAIEALMVLGYGSKEARQALDKLDQTETLENKIRIALKILSNRR